MDKTDIEKFDPTKAELEKMVAKTISITAVDLTDKKQVEVVRAGRIELKNTRVKIERHGKSLREDAIAFQKAVIAKEKELVGIIAPEEERLAAIEEEAQVLEVKREREEMLPTRKRRLADVYGKEIVMDDGFLLSMDNLGFEVYFNECVAKKNEADKAETERVAAEAAAKLAKEREAAEKKAADEAARVKAEQDAKAGEIAAAQAKVDADRLAVEREKERVAAEAAAKVREEAARAEERAKAEADSKKKEADRIAAEKKAKADADAKEAADKKALEQKEAYVKFRADLGWTEATADDFKAEASETQVVLWKKVGVFKKSV